MLRQFFRGVPDELEESAYLDGANTFRTFWQIILPLSIPMMITVFLFAFCWQWTDDFYVRLFYISVDKPSLMAYLSDGLPLSFASLITSYTEITHQSADYVQAMKYGCGVMVCLPLTILYLFCQKFLVQGIERSGIVG
jgi:multiple sugar transport system permease protein